MKANDKWIYCAYDFMRLFPVIPFMYNNDSISNSGGEGGRHRNWVVSYMFQAKPFPMYG